MNGACLPTFLSARRLLYRQLPTLHQDVGIREYVGYAVKARLNEDQILFRMAQTYMQCSQKIQYSLASFCRVT